MSISNVTSSILPHLAQASKKETQNILYRIQELVSRINSQLSRLSEEGQTRSQTMKKEYRASSAKAADLQKQTGSAAPMISGLALLCMGIANAASYKLGEKGALISSLSKVASDQIPSFGEWYKSSLVAKQMREQSISSLRQTEIGNEGQKSGEARDFQSELQQIIGNLRELFKKASS